MNLKTNETLHTYSLINTNKITYLDLTFECYFSCNIKKM